MQITNELGQKVIKRLSEYIDVDINIMNLDGKIVASTDTSRISEIHGGAIEVIRTGDAVILNENVVRHYPKTKPGVNLPILHQEKMAGVVGVSGNPDDILRITGLVKASVEIVIDQIHIQRQAFFMERQWGYWLQQLLHPGGFDQNKLIEEAAYSLNVDTETYWQVIIIQRESIHNSLEMVRQEINSRRINSLFILPFLENEIVIALNASFDRVEPLVKELLYKIGECRLGVGEKAFGIKGIRESYEQAKQVLFFEVKKAIAFSTEWKLERLTVSIPEVQYHSICFSYEQLLDGLGDPYKNTIDTYFNTDFSIKETAIILDIHRNTLLYRLDQIKIKVGLDPRSFHDAFLLKIIRSRQI